MNELIKITENNGKRAVNARDLHAFLEVKKDFSDWIKHRIKKYDLVENQDYQVFPQIGENPQGGRPVIEYALSINCAKELAMVEGNDQGKQARQYFLECERIAREEDKDLTELEMLRANIDRMIKHEREIKAHEKKIKSLEVTVEMQEEQIKELEIKTNTRPDYYSVMAYSILIEKTVNYKTANMLGRKAAALSRARNMPIDKVKDPRFGYVGMYHESILKQVFNNYKNERIN